MPNWEPFISVIMPAFNVSQYLNDVFDALDEVDYPKNKLEIILVDNGSEDDTVAMAKERCAIVLEQPEAKLGGLRNRGAKKAKGEILAFLDSDCVVDTTWLKYALPYLKMDDVGGVGSHTRIPENATWVERVLDFHATKDGFNEVEYLPTANLIVKRAVFEKVGGFDSDIETGEDSDFCYKIRKLKFRLISDSKILVIHMGYPKNLWQLYKKEMWHFKESFSLLLSTNFRLEYIFGIVIPFIYAFCLLGTLGLMTKAIFRVDGILLFYATITFFFIPVSLAIYKAFDKRKIRYSIFSVFYFTVILLARINVSLSFFWEKIRSLFLRSLRHL